MEVALMWRLYYQNRTVFSSTDGPWRAAPAWGVMGLAYLDDEVGYYRNTNHFYIFPPWASTPYGCDHWGLMDYLLRIGELEPNQPLTTLPATRLEDAGVKFGRTIDDDEWREVLSWMANDPELPHKSARRRDERVA